MFSKECAPESLFSVEETVLNPSCTLLAQLCVCLAAPDPVIVFQSNQPVVATPAGLALIIPPNTLNVPLIIFH